MNLSQKAASQYFWIALVAAGCGSGIGMDPMEDADGSGGSSSAEGTGGSSVSKGGAGGSTNATRKGQGGAGRAGTGGSGKEAGGALVDGGEEGASEATDDSRPRGTGGRTNRDGGAGGRAGSEGDPAETGGQAGQGGRSRPRATGGMIDGGRDSGGDTPSTGGSKQPVGAAGRDAGDCPAQGHVTYSLEKAASPTSTQTAMYQKITTAMDTATSYYNCYTNITKALRISYVPSVATADGNSNGSIRFGSESTMQHITAMHEISHTVGVGTSPGWAKLLSNKVFTGKNATSQLREITGKNTDVVNADTQHFWPYGLNYTSEVKSTDDLVNHCKMVSAILEDLDGT